MNKRILMLANYHPRYIKPLQQWSKRLESKGYAVIQMYPDAYYKEDILEELGKGYDLIVYFGHGKPGALCGYCSITTKDIRQIKAAKPNRIIAALTCYSMTKCRKSIGDVLIQAKVAQNVAGYRKRVKYEDNLDALNQMFNMLMQPKMSWKKFWSSLPSVLDTIEAQKR